MIFVIMIGADWKTLLIKLTSFSLQFCYLWCTGPSSVMEIQIYEVCLEGQFFFLNQLESLKGIEVTGVHPFLLPDSFIERTNK